jgi:DNA-binding MarR family transcriptional regulator
MTQNAEQPTAVNLATGRPGFGFMLRDVTQRYIRRFEDRARELSLTLPQCRTLVILESHQGLSQARLARLANSEPMAMVRMLDRMEKDGLLERRPDPVDRRARRLYLTRAARPLLRRIWRLVDLTREELFSGVSRRDRTLFLKVLAQLHENANAMPIAPATPTGRTNRQPRRA